METKTDRKTDLDETKFAHRDATNKNMLDKYTQVQPMPTLGDSIDICF